MPADRWLTALLKPRSDLGNPPQASAGSRRPSMTRYARRADLGRRPRGRAVWKWAVRLTLRLVFPHPVATGTGSGLHSLRSRVEAA